MKHTPSFKDYAGMVLGFVLLIILVSFTVCHADLLPDPVKTKAYLEARLTNVTTTEPIAVANWYGGQNIHIHTKTYFKFRVTARLDTVGFDTTGTKVRTSFPLYYTETPTKYIFYTFNKGVYYTIVDTAWFKDITDTNTYLTICRYFWSHASSVSTERSNDLRYIKTLSPVFQGRVDAAGRIQRDFNKKTVFTFRRSMVYGFKK